MLDFTNIRAFPRSNIGTPEASRHGHKLSILFEETFQFRVIELEAMNVDLEAFGGQSKNGGDLVWYLITTKS